LALDGKRPGRRVVAAGAAVLPWLLPAP
jgi:hypothetical protein